MVKVKYSHRIICDSSFIAWVSNHKERLKIISSLMHIKSSSFYNRKSHSVILNSDADKSVYDKIMKDKNNIGRFCKVIPDPDYLNDRDSLLRVIFFSIDLTSEPPYKSFIFTSPEMEESYKNNNHYKSVKSVSVKAGEDALFIIDNYFKEFTLQRERDRDYISR